VTDTQNHVTYMCSSVVSISKGSETFLSSCIPTVQKDKNHLPVGMCVLCMCVRVHVCTCSCETKYERWYFNEMDKNHLPVCMCVLCMCVRVHMYMCSSETKYGRWCFNKWKTCEDQQTHMLQTVNLYMIEV
jgi:hypothetical protein